MQATWWLSNQKMTVKIVVKGTKIIDAAPVVRKFIGQPFQNIITWMNRIAPPLNWECLAVAGDDDKDVIYRIYSSANSGADNVTLPLAENNA